ncbi:nesprin-1-like [Amphiura filiformis]|uniref:nesprin-1-like n=1 Tax=Amphiura filiformis TaxID=82378 RepID=UPI003B214870
MVLLAVIIIAEAGTPLPEVKDFGPSWRDGNAFNVLINSIQSDLVDLESLAHRTNVEKLENAFDVAERELGIARLLDPHDVDVDKPDERSIMTYVSQFFKSYPEAGTIPKDPENDPVAIQERHMCQQVQEWSVKGQAMMIAATRQSIQRTLTMDEQYGQFIAFQVEHEHVRRIAAIIMEKKKKKVLVTMTEEQYVETLTKFTKVELEYKEWRRNLEITLPGQLGKIGTWLDRAETLMGDELKPLESQEETCSSMRRKLDEHVEHFKEAHIVHRNFLHIKQSGGRVGSEKVPEPILDNMALRFEDLIPAAERKQVKLEYLEKKYKLLSFIVMAEKKLQSWTVKYKTKETVVEVLETYKSFIKDGQFFEQYERTLRQVDTVSEVYHRQLTDAKEKENVKKFMHDMVQKKRNLTVEIQSVKTMLEEVIDHWDKYANNVEALQKWLEEAEKVLQQGDEQTKMHHFRDLAHWLDRHTSMNESGNFLIEMCQEDVTFEVQQQLLLINRRWKEVFEESKGYMKSDEALRQQQEFNQAVTACTRWLEQAEPIVLQPSPCTSWALKEHAQLLDELRNQVPSQEYNLKQLSQLAQAMVKHLNKDQATGLVTTLRGLKDRLVTVRDTIPIKAQVVNGVLPVARQYEDGMEEIRDWIEDAEKMVDGRDEVPKDQKEKQKKLRKHKLHFSKSKEIGLQLEDKSHIVKYIVSQSTTYVETTKVESTVADLMLRFKNCVSQSRDSEDTLSGRADLWKDFAQKESNLSDWLKDAAKKLKDDKGPINKQLEKHKETFGSAEPDELEQFVTASQQLLHALPSAERHNVEPRIRALQEQYQDVRDKAAHKSLGLEFQVTADELKRNLKAGEVEVTAEEKGLQFGMDSEDLIHRHEEFFQEQELLDVCTTQLEQLESMAHRLQTSDPSNQSPTKTFQECQERHDKLCTQVEDLYRRLQQWPSQWKDYQDRLSSLEQWIQDANNTMKAIIATDDYDSFRQLCAKLQTIREMVPKTQQECSWLQDAFHNLAKSLPAEKASTENQNLSRSLRNHKAVVAKLDNFTPEMESKQKMFDYKKAAKDARQWLGEKQASIAEPPVWESSEVLKEQIEDHQGLEEELAASEAQLKQLIQDGKDLHHRHHQHHQHHPEQPHSALADTVKQQQTGLEKDWVDTKTRAAQKGQWLHVCT